MRSKINRRLLFSTMSLRAKRRNLVFQVIAKYQIATWPYWRLAMTRLINCRAVALHSL